MASAVGGKPEREKVGIWWYGTGDKLNSISGWDGLGVNGDDIYGFSALPGGYRYLRGNFKGISAEALWWTATEYFRDNPYVWSTIIGHTMALQDIDKRVGASVRCVQNKK